MATRHLHLGRVLLAGLLADGVPIFLLIAATGLFGPKEPAAAQAWAERTGQWLGPLSGSIAVFFAATWVIWPLSHAHKRNAMATGAVAALIDILLLIAAAAPFRWLFVVSNVGRLFAAWLAAYFAKPRRLRKNLR